MLRATLTIAPAFIMDNDDEISQPQLVDDIIAADIAETAAAPAVVGGGGRVHQGRNNVEICGWIRRKIETQFAEPSIATWGEGNRPTAAPRSPTSPVAGRRRAHPSAGESGARGGLKQQSRK